MTAQPAAALSIDDLPEDQTLPGIELPETAEALREFAWAAQIAGPVNIHRLCPPSAPERHERIDRRVMIRG